jgi:hypothetical protein
MQVLAGPRKSFAQHEAHARSRTHEFPESPEPALAPLARGGHEDRDGVPAGRLQLSALSRTPNARPPGRGELVEGGPAPTDRPQESTGTSRLTADSALAFYRGTRSAPHGVLRSCPSRPTGWSSRGSHDDAGARRRRSRCHHRSDPAHPDDAPRAGDFSAAHRLSRRRVDHGQEAATPETETDAARRGQAANDSRFPRRARAESRAIDARVHPENSIRGREARVTRNGGRGPVSGISELRAVAVAAKSGRPAPENEEEKRRESPPSTPVTTDHKPSEGSGGPG